MANKIDRIYTYAVFAKEVIALAKGDFNPTESEKKRLIEKAENLLEVQQAKQAYNKNKPKVAKGPNEKTQQIIAVIQPILCDVPQTSADLNLILKTDFSPLQVANAVKYIEGIQSTKVVRSTINAKGLRAEKEYTAYFID